MPWTCLVSNALSIVADDKMVQQCLTHGPTPLEAWENQQRLNWDPPPLGPQFITDMPSA